MSDCSSSFPACSPVSMSPVRSLYAAVRSRSLLTVVSPPEEIFVSVASSGRLSAIRASFRRSVVRMPAVIVALSASVAAIRSAIIFVLFNAVYS